MQTLQVPMRLEGLDGNAFSLLGAFSKNARRAGYSKEEVDLVIKEATKGDYDHLLQTLIANTI